MTVATELKEGVSVIVPTYEGQHHIQPLLNSLKEQTINKDLFEVLFIINGEKDETSNIIKKFQQENPEINIVLTESEKGSSVARNKGILLAKREYVTFIDDDDYISPNYLKKFFDNAKPNRIVLGTFIDVDDETKQTKESYILKEQNDSLSENAGLIDNAFVSIPTALIITTNKLIPTIHIKNNLFSTELNSGEDIVYYAELYSKKEFEFYLLGEKEGAVYYRILREDSISRRQLSYQFNVIDRLNVIKKINDFLKVAENNNIKIFFKKLVVGQIRWLREYVDERPEDLKKVLREINKYNLDYFPYKYLDTDPEEEDKQNSELVISYTLPPISSTSGNVVAKKILLNKRNVSVIRGTLENEIKNPSLGNLIDDYINETMKIEVNDFFFKSSGKKFAVEGLKVLNNKPTYEKVYSRAQFVPSHLLGYLYKINHDTHWTAEFSDPIIYSMEGKYQSGPMEDEEFVAEINKGLPEGFDKVKASDTTNEIIEYITFVMADEIIFTNENQMEIMLEDFPEIKDIVYEKSKIVPHPTLDEKYYYISDVDYEIDENYVNFAYFGVLYGNRSLEEFIAGFNNINEKFEDKFRLHVFTPNVALLERLLTPELREKTVINPSVDYLDFLNLTTKMDVLLVEDAAVSTYPINPFLPSKVSDYRGSGTDIWAICEKNSIMSGIDDIKYKSAVADFNSSKMTLDRIMSDKLGVEIESEELSKEEIIDYYHDRHVDLITKMIQLNTTVNQSVAKEKSYKEKLQFMESRLQEYRDYTNYLRKWMRPKFLFNFLKKIRNYYRKFKNRKNN